MLSFYWDLIYKRSWAKDLELYCSTFLFWCQKHNVQSLFWLVLGLFVNISWAKILDSFCCSTLHFLVSKAWKMSLSWVWGLFGRNHPLLVPKLCLGCDFEDSSAAISVECRPSWMRCASKSSCTKTSWGHDVCSADVLVVVWLLRIIESVPSG